MKTTLRLLLLVAMAHAPLVSAQLGDSPCAQMETRFSNDGIETYEGERISKSPVYLTALGDGRSPEIRRVIRIEHLPDGRLTGSQLARGVRLDFSGHRLMLVFSDSDGQPLATVPARGEWICEGRVRAWHHDDRKDAEGSPGKVHVDETLEQMADGSLVWIEATTQIEGRNWGGPANYRVTRRFPRLD